MIDTISEEKKDTETVSNEKIDTELLKKQLMPKSHKSLCLENLWKALLRIGGYFYPITFYFYVYPEMTTFFKYIVWVINGIIIIISLLSIAFELSDRIFDTGGYTEYKKQVYNNMGRGDDVEQVKELSDKNLKDTPHISSANYTLAFLTMAVIITPAWGVLNLGLMFYHLFCVIFKIKE